MNFLLLFCIFLKPWMIQSLWKLHPLLRILPRQPQNKILELLRHFTLIFRELNILVKNIPEQLFLFIRCKRRPLIHELISQNTETPIVDLVVKRSVLDDLWAKVVRSTTECLSVCGCGLDGPAEVAELQGVILRDQNILRLDIAVDYVQALQVMNCLDHLKHVILNLLLSKVVLFHYAIQISIWSVVHHDSDIFLVMEVSIHWKDILML